MLDDHHVVLRRKGPRSTAAGVVRRVHYNVRPANCRRVARDRATVRATVHQWRTRRADKVPNQIRPNLPLKGAW